MILGGVRSRTITLVEQATGMSLPSETHTLTMFVPRLRGKLKVTTVGFGG